MTKDIHNIQALILKALLFKTRAKFSELNVENWPSDQFSFHIKRLLEEKIIEKDQSGLYLLTLSGKDYANRFDVDSNILKIEKQAKLGVLVVAILKDGQRLKYLMQTRLKQPFFGFRGFVTGKIKIGEEVSETAKRELKEETGLDGNVEQKAIYHERIFSESGELLEDKYFFVFVADNLSGKLINEIQGGKNEWVSEADLFKGNIFYDIADLLKLTKQKTLTFSEKSYTVSKY